MQLCESSYNNITYKSAPKSLKISLFSHLAKCPFLLPHSLDFSITIQGLQQPSSAAAITVIFSHKRHLLNPPTKTPLQVISIYMSPPTRTPSLSQLWQVLYKCHISLFTAATTHIRPATTDPNQPQQTPIQPPKNPSTHPRLTPISLRSSSLNPLVLCIVWWLLYISIYCCNK